MTAAEALKLETKKAISVVLLVNLDAVLSCFLIKGVLVLVYAYGMIWIDLSLQRQTYF